MKLTTLPSILLVGECSAFLASGSDPTDERCMKHGPQTTPRRGRRELAACALTERVIASRALTFHRVMHRECAHAFFSCNAYLETLRYVPESPRPDTEEVRQGQRLRNTHVTTRIPKPHTTRVLFMCVGMPGT